MTTAYLYTTSISDTMTNICPSDNLGSFASGTDILQHFKHCVSNYVNPGSQDWSMFGRKVILN